MFPDDGKVIGGNVSEASRKRIRVGQRILRKPRAIAFDVSTLCSAEATGAVNVLVIHDEKDAELRAPITKTWERGSCVNRGHGGQIVLALNEWACSDELTDAQFPLWGAT